MSEREWLVRRVTECRVMAPTASDALEVSQDDGAIAETVEVLVTALGPEKEVLLELESRLGPNPLSPDDPPNVHTPEGHPT